MEDAFRSLVVVRGSHNDGTFEELSPDLKGRCQAKKLASSAHQLDVRPNDHSDHRSALVLWNSRLVHQGHTFWPTLTQGFQPEVKVPRMKNVENEFEWKRSLDKKGYVVLADLLEPETVEQALAFLLEDIQPPS
eukprot:Skav208663  [mRNA]  locus=scaffold3341:72277:76153:+ [translate_table: standard]